MERGAAWREAVVLVGSGRSYGGVSNRSRGEVGLVPGKVHQDRKPWVRAGERVETSPYVDEGRAR